MLSTTSEYALRALVQMATLPPDTPALSQDLARATKVPRNYLSKILLALRNAGILDSARGAGGGYRLRKPSDQIFLIDVVEIFEGSKATPNCLLNNRQCCEGTPCAAHRTWRELSMVYAGFLISTSLAQVAGLTAKPVPVPSTEGLGANDQEAVVRH